MAEPTGKADTMIRNIFLFAVFKKEDLFDELHLAKYT